MIAKRSLWRVRLTLAADNDLGEIGNWTANHFGKAQSQAYGQLIFDALIALKVGPSADGVKPRDEVAPGIFSLHISRAGRNGRHFLIFRIVSEERREIEVVRILHDSMDIGRHLPPA